MLKCTIPVRVALQEARLAPHKQKIAILVESGELGVPDPCEGCTLLSKMAILAESGELGVPDPCEGCTPKMKIAILAESGDDQVCDFVRVARFYENA